MAKIDRNYSSGGAWRSRASLIADIERLEEIVSLYRNDQVTAGVVSYLRSRAKAEMATTDQHPDASMLSKAADMIESLASQLVVVKDRSVALQRKIGEYEAREIGGEA
jgi:hypothetical protein